MPSTVDSANGSNCRSLRRMKSGLRMKPHRPLYSNVPRFSCIARSAKMHKSDRPNLSLMYRAKQAAHWHTVSVMRAIIFLWFLLFSMCEFFNVAVSKCINWRFVHLLLLMILLLYWPNVWKLSATSWQPAFQNICSNTRANVSCIIYQQRDGDDGRLSEPARLLKPCNPWGIFDALL